VLDLKNAQGAKKDFYSTTDNVLMPALMDLLPEKTNVLLAN
jgi:hypothetical protein